MGAIHVTHDAHVSVVTIDDAERYNAMSLSMWIALKQAFDAIEANPDVRAVILRGAGEKAFVSGANISEFETHPLSELMPTVAPGALRKDVLDAPDVFQRYWGRSSATTFQLTA